MTLELFKPGVGIRDRVPGIPQSRSRKSWTGTGTHLKSGTGTGTQIQNLQYRGLGKGLRLARRIPGLNFGGLSRRLKYYWTRSRGLKVFRDTVPVPCRPLVWNLLYQKNEIMDSLSSGTRSFTLSSSEMKDFRKASKRKHSDASTLPPYPKTESL